MSCGRWSGVMAEYRETAVQLQNWILSHTYLFLAAGSCPTARKGECEANGCVCLEHFLSDTPKTA